MALKEPAWYVVKEIFDAASGIRTMRLAPEKPVDFSFRPGQFIALRQSDEQGNVYRKMYSVASSPLKPGEIEITFRVLGVFTQRMAAFKPGDRILLDGPYGAFVFDESKPNAVFLAGGCGITPFMSMLRYAAEKKLANKITLFYSCRNKAESPYTNELEQLAQQNPNLTLVCTLTREQPPGWKGELGRVDGNMLKKYLRGLEDAQFYICGTPEMSKGFSDMLQQLGVKKESIHMEGW